MISQYLDRIHAALYLWYPFQPQGRLLYISEVDDKGFKLLEGRVAEIVTCTVDSIPKGQYFDYVLCMSLPEKIKASFELLKSCISCLKPSGLFLFPMNNRLGIRYFCGDRDPYTEHVFDSIDNYANADLKNIEHFTGGMYSKSEIEDLLHDAGIQKSKFYSVFPGLEYPQHLATWGYIPMEDLANRITPVYHYPMTVFLKEEEIYKSLSDNELLHPMANAWLVECGGKESKYADCLYVTASLDRSPYNAMITIIHDDRTVSKQAVFAEGDEAIKTLCENTEALKKRNIPVVNVSRCEGAGGRASVKMSYVDEPTGQAKLIELLEKGEQQFLDAFDRFMELIDCSADIIREDPEYGPIAKRVYPDMVPLNSFYVHGDFVFFDQEFVFYDYPINAVKARALLTFFAYHDDKRWIEDRLYQRYGLEEKKSTYQHLETNFLHELWNERLLGKYKERIRRNTALSDQNRLWMNHPADRYRKCFLDIFDGAEKKDCYLFGSGRYAESFIDLYGMLFHIKGIFDNNRKRWGEDIRGIPIFPPDMLKKLPVNEIKVFICMKDYQVVVRQLDEYRLLDYSIYDRTKTYRRSLYLKDISEDDSKSKPYHIGYISGTFDLFHKGHLNLLKEAKTRCDYLIVGVVSDEGVRRFKHVEPFIPFAERREMVEACRYVDKAVEIPLFHRDIRNAYALYHFDCQFCGSDYYEDPVFMTDRKWLKEQGSNMEILPYTQSTSSSKIKELIDKGLL